MYVFYHTFGARCCLFFFLFLGILPNFRGAFTAFTFLSRGMKQIPRFFLNGEEHSFLPSDRQYTLQRSYFVPPLFSFFLHQSTHSLLLFSFPKPQNSHKKGASQSPASTPKIKYIFFAFF